MSKSSRLTESAKPSWDDDDKPFRLVLVLLALSTLATTAGVLLATAVHI